MTFRHSAVWGWPLAVGLLGGCTLPGRPKADVEAPRPEAVTSFKALYGENCAGCHGVDGQNGPATDLANPEYQALVDDKTLHDVIAYGEPGSLMPAFGREAGGMLTDAQVGVLTRGMRDQWSKGDMLSAQNAPPYKATHSGDPARGQAVYVAACARCHGASAQSPGPNGSVLDGSFLALVTPQALRTTIIAGRPDLGQPDWRNDLSGHPLTDENVTDLVTWMVAQKPASPGQPYPNTRPAVEPRGEGHPTNVDKNRK